VDSYLKQILKKENLTPSEKKTAKDEINKLVIEQRALTRAMNEAKAEGDDKGAHYIKVRRNDVMDKKEELRNSLGEKVTINFKNNVGFTIKRDYLESLKDPEKYIQDKHINATKKQINDLQEQGNTSTAKGLGNLLKASYPENENLKSYIETIEEKAAEEGDLFWDELLSGMDELKEIDYTPIFVVSGNHLKVIYARKKKD